MARVLSEGSGKGVEMQETILKINDSGTINLPDGVEASACEITRDGQDLVLTTPDGEVLVVENYFSLPDAPVIVSDSGALLSAALVMSFIKPAAGDIQVAATETANDESPVGEVTEVTGAATVTHADGTKETITAGTQIFEGDIVETDAKGAVNIKFADDSTFAVSENARLAVDDFSFNAETQSGTTGLSILRGVFMFTSGLIGRENPDAVTLETPVGSIGIRGTIIGGNIKEGGESTISVIEGAIVVRNGTGEQILSQQYETVTLTAFSQPIVNIGTMNVGQMTQTYGAVRPVAPSLFTSIDDSGRDAPAQQQTAPEQQPQTQQTEQPAAPETNTAPEAVPPALPPMTNTPVFQELTTGSNIDNALGAPAPVHTQQPSTPPLTPITAAPPVTQAPLPPAPPVIDTGDRRAPSGVSIVSGGAYAENNAVGAEVARVSLSDTTMKFPVRYELVNNTGPFTIDSDGRIFVTASGNYEADPHSYNFTVRAIRVDTNQTSETPLTINLTNVDEAPKFDAGSTQISVDEGAYIHLTVDMLKSSDPENDALTFRIEGQTKGVIEVDRGSGFQPLSDGETFTMAEVAADKVKYLHLGDEPGGATITLVAIDPAGNESAAQQFLIDIDGQNDAPIEVISNGGAIAENAEFITITKSMLENGDSDNAPSEVVYIVSQFEHGTLYKHNGTAYVALHDNDSFTQADINSGKIAFTQNGDEHGTAGFSYTVGDGTAPDASLKPFVFTVTNVNDAPTASESDITIDEDTSGTVDLLALTADVDSTLTGASIAVGNAAYGTVTYDSGTGIATYAPDTNYNGSDSFTFTVTDSNGASVTKTISVTVDPINDAPTSFSATSANVSIDEGTDTVPTHIVDLNITDAEAASGGYSFEILRHDGAGYVNDGIAQKFDIVEDNGTYSLVLKANQTLDAETLNAIDLKITMTDGTHSLATDVTVAVNDVNEAATAFHVNNDIDFMPGTYDVLLQGNKTGAHMAVLHADDLDVTSPNRPGYQNFRVTQISGTTGGLDVNDFEIVEIGSKIVLKLVDGKSGDFTSPGTFQVTIQLDANQAGGFEQAGVDLEQTLTFVGRNDTMILEMVDGSNGFRIVNDHRGGTNGAFFGFSAVAGNFLGDGHTDLLFGAPRAHNSNSISIGGVYGFDGASLLADAADGRVHLSSLTGYQGELAGTISSENSYYGADVAIVNNFRLGKSMMAVTNSKNGVVHIIDPQTPANNFNITGIPTTGSDGAYGKLTVASIGDINGDGYGDLLIGSPTAGGGVGIAGIALGNDTGSPVVWANLDHLVSDGGGFGSQVTGLGDFDGDGRNDFAIASQYFDTGGGSQTSQGKLSVYYGTNNMLNLNTSKLTIRGLDTNDQAQLGSLLANAGDFNSDGKNDLMFRVDNKNIALVFGDSSLHNRDLSITDLNIAAGFNGITITKSGMGANDKLAAISSAGDFNGDGYSDIVVDFSHYLSAGEFEHTLYVLYGTSAGPSAYDLSALTAGSHYTIKLLSKTAESLTLSSAGDFNGDGFDDLIVGDPGSQGPFAGTVQDGSATVVYGSNYDGKATLVAASVDLTAGGDRTFVGDSGNNTVRTMGEGGVSFRGGAGDDTLEFKGNDTFSINNFEHFDGGAGTDTLRLFFSQGESTGTADIINLQDLRIKASGVEKILLAADSQMDRLELDIRDVLTLAQENGTNKLFITLEGTDPATTTNTVKLFNNGSELNSMTAVSMLGLSLVKDAPGSPTGQDTLEVDGVNYYVYTHNASHAELLVDARISNAANFFSV